MGLDFWKHVYTDHPEIQAIIGPTLYLMQRTFSRPKGNALGHSGFSLDICPLGELIDMYHTRKATERHDKVYALLGMCSDSHGLVPDYTMEWCTLLQQVVVSALGGQVSVNTWSDRELAVIQGKGAVVGKVFSAKSDPVRVGEMTIEIGLGVAESLDQQANRSTQCLAQTPAKPIQDGDLICIMDGAAKPTVIRLCGEYCIIIAISIDIPDYRQSESGGIGWQNVSTSGSHYGDFLLIWDCEGPRGCSEAQRGYTNLLLSRLPEHEQTESQGHGGEATRQRNASYLAEISNRYGGWVLICESLELCPSAKFVLIGYESKNTKPQTKNWRTSRGKTSSCVTSTWLWPLHWETYAYPPNLYFAYRSY